MTDVILHYLADFTDEVMPCAPTLEGWAEWLADPEEGWGEGPTATPGQIFDGYTMTRHPNVSARWDGEALILTPEPPPGADFFALARSGGGWDVEYSGNTPAEALLVDGEPADLLAAVGADDVELACCTGSRETVHYQFDIIDGAPRLTVVAPQ